MPRPKSNEYAEYFGRYVDRVPDGDIIETLAAQLDSFLALVRGIGADKGGHRYSPGKWSIKEVFGHIVDCERWFSTRAMAFSRNDKTPLPSFEHAEYVRGANFDSRLLDDLSEEFEHLRKSALVLFRSFDEEIWRRRGTAGGNEFTVRAIPWVMAGHLDHHKNVLLEKYL